MQKPCVKPDTGQHPSNLGRWHVEQQAASSKRDGGEGRWEGTDVGLAEEGFDVLVLDVLDDSTHTLIWAPAPHHT